MDGSMSTKAAEIDEEKSSDSLFCNFSSYRGCANESPGISKR